MYYNIITRRYGTRSSFEVCNIFTYVQNTSARARGVRKTGGRGGAPVAPTETCCLAVWRSSAQTVKNKQRPSRGKPKSMIDVPVTFFRVSRLRDCIFKKKLYFQSPWVHIIILM